MTDSILDTTKKFLGLDSSYTDFDMDIREHINSVFSTLCQLGIGPANGYRIEDASATWADFLGSNLHYSSVRSYMYLRVRLLFDLPATSYAIDAIKSQIQEMEWRLSVDRESIAWVDPTTGLPPVAPVLPPITDDQLNEVVEQVEVNLDEDAPSFALIYQNGKV